MIDQRVLQTVERIVEEELDLSSNAMEFDHAMDIDHHEENIKSGRACNPFSKLDLSKVCVPVTVQKPIPVRSPREEIEKIHSSNSPATKQKRRNSKESIRASRKFSDTRTLDYRKVGTMHFVTKRTKTG
mmetsp:Transcript_16603/g.28277  ORF Transcript_16603/g.28277 Transcript_16603/m.28277 type:complete len:129 (+) Transcript_16603:21-407(+)